MVLCYVGPYFFSAAACYRTVRTHCGWAPVSVRVCSMATDPEVRRGVTSYIFCYSRICEVLDLIIVGDLVLLSLANTQRT